MIKNFIEMLKALVKLSFHLIKGNQNFQEKCQQNVLEEFETSNPYVNQVREWAVNKINHSNESKNANAIAAEFDEWIHISNKNEMEYMYLEDQEWTDEQEIDVR
jgi:hypothetical protein